MQRKRAPGNAPRQVHQVLKRSNRHDAIKACIQRQISQIAVMRSKLFALGACGEQRLKGLHHLVMLDRGLITPMIQIACAYFKHPRCWSLSAKVRSHCPVHPGLGDSG
ncbi:MAG: hypothetical protein EBX30_14515 [Betaproteobacteria bacterium]|nr:hypothetical protein [Betaproteobacteria bacterium]NDG83038.1 hypothetical protein [Betaproteobacteria bacterium]